MVYKKKENDEFWENFALTLNFGGKEIIKMAFKTLNPTPNLS